jgi:hypothetical protein
MMLLSRNDTKEAIVLPKTRGRDDAAKFPCHSAAALDFSPANSAAGYSPK